MADAAKQIKQFSLSRAGGGGRRDAWRNRNAVIVSDGEYGIKAT